MLDLIYFRIVKAAVLIKHGKAKDAFEIRNIDAPKPKDHEALVDVEAFGLNYADVMARNGLYREAPPLPSILGYDFVGRVKSCKDPSFKHLIGKRVVGLSRFGAYAEQVVTNPLALAPVSEDVSPVIATALGTQYLTAYHAACQITNLNQGERVLIHAAAGGVGTALTQIALWKGCEVFGSAGSEEKMSYLREQGVHHPINYKASDYAQQIRKILGEKSIDVSFNPIAGRTFKKDLKLIGSGGRLVLFGAAERSGMNGLFATYRFLARMGLLIPIVLMAKSRSILGVNMLKVADHKPEVVQHAMDALISLLEQGIINPQIGGKYHVNDLALAHQLLEDGKTTGKLSVLW